MKNEIERKFYIKEMPDLSGIVPLRYERYFLSRDGGKEARIQKVNDACFYEEKTTLSDTERTRKKKQITEEQFNALKTQSSGKPIIRDRYDISTDPLISIQVYHGNFQGLVRAEVEFVTKEEADTFRPLEWMGEEITGLPIARDASLLDLSDAEFKKYIQQ